MKIFDIVEALLKKNIEISSPKLDLEGKINVGENQQFNIIFSEKEYSVNFGPAGSMDTLLFEDALRVFINRIYEYADGKQISFIRLAMPNSIADCCTVIKNNIVIRHIKEKLPPPVNTVYERYDVLIEKVK